MPSSATRLSTPLAPTSEVLSAPTSIRLPETTTKNCSTSLAQYGPDSSSARPLSRLSEYLPAIRSPGMIREDRKVSPPVKMKLNRKMAKAAFFRFLIFGSSISRYTCARVSRPLIARMEWPKAMKMPTSPTLCQTGRFFIQPRDSSVNLSSKGGRTNPRIATVTSDQSSSTAPTTVTTPMILKFLSLDSSTPFIFSRQKYAVASTPKTTAKALGGTCQWMCSSGSRLVSSPET